YGGGDHRFHASHEEGRDVDFRMVRKDKENGSLSYTDSTNYDQDGTITLLETIFDTGLAWQANNADIWGDVQMIEQVYYNDPVVQDHFKNYKGYNRDMVVSSPDHDDHVHLRFRLPKRILDDEANGYQICDERLPQLDDSLVNETSCSTDYPELQTFPSAANDFLPYEEAATYLNSKYPTALARSVFVLMGAEAAKNKDKTAFKSAGGHNY